MNTSNGYNYTIRKAEARDLEKVADLLTQVLRIHHAGRPDLFKSSGRKYTDEQLLDIFADPRTPVFVYEEDGKVQGYAFCAFQSQDANNLEPVKTLYIDDICIDEASRGKGIGKAIFGYVRQFALDSGCHNITLHVWECNPGARAFYEAMGMKPQYLSMESVLL